MSFLRYDVTTHDWVIFAPERARRPNDFKKEKPAVAPPGEESHCPFCPGNEHLTGPEIYAVRDNTPPNKPGWQVRVVPNKFPALCIEEDPRRLEDGPFHRHMGGCGAHEVIIESPDHNRFPGEQSIEQIELLLRTLHVRFNDLMRDARFQTIILFKNHGVRAGTSLHHPHWQLIATPVVPRMLRTKYAVATDYFDATGHCLYCEMLAEELSAEQRVLAENQHFAAILPYASHVPFEIWILPKEHQASFGTMDASRLRPLAELLKLVLLKLYVGLENPDFNLTVNTVPRGDEDKMYFLWHLQIVPRLTTPAGFELGTGMAINFSLPEDAAAYLRDIKIGG